MRAGNLRALAVLSDHRSASAPEIQTTAELGMPDLVLESFYGLFAPLGTPKDILQRLGTDIGTILSRDDVKSKLLLLGVEVAPDTSATVLAQRTRDEQKMWAPIVRDLHITIS